MNKINLNTKNIKLSSACSLSIRTTKNNGFHIALFHQRKILYRITKENLLRLGRQIILNQIVAAPFFIPLPLAEIILNLVDGSIELVDFYNIIKTIHNITV